MSGYATAIGLAISAASAGYAASQGAPKASGAIAMPQIGGSLNNAAAARSLLLETAGGSAGQQIGPGGVSNNSKTNTFGN